MSTREWQIIPGVTSVVDVIIERIDAYIETGIYSVRVSRCKPMTLAVDEDTTENVDFQGARAAEQSEQVYCALIAAAMLRAVLP